MLRGCRDVLAYSGYYTIDLHLQGEVQFKSGSTRKLGERGRPDLLGVKPNHAVFVECKRPAGGRLGVEQEIWHSHMRARGFDVLVIRDPLELKRWLRRYAETIADEEESYP